MDQLREEQRYDREKTAFQDKHRKAIAKQEKKEGTNKLGGKQTGERGRNKQTGEEGEKQTKELSNK